MILPPFGDVVFFVDEVGFLEVVTAGVGVDFCVDDTVLGVGVGVLVLESGDAVLPVLAVVDTLFDVGDDVLFGDSVSGVAEGVSGLCDAGLLAAAVDGLGMIVLFGVEEGGLLGLGVGDLVLAGGVVELVVGAWVEVDDTEVEAEDEGLLVVVGALVEEVGAFGTVEVVVADATEGTFESVFTVAALVDKTVEVVVVD